KRRNKDAAGGKGPGEDFFDQLVRLHQVYAVGFSDPNWAAQVRGEGASTSTPSHRQRFIDLAREQLSASAIDSMLSAKQFSRVWDELVGILKQTNLVPAAQLKLKFVGAEQERTLAAAVRELLHGSTPYNQRFDRYLSAFAAAFNQPAKWELATAPAAIVSPREHICVELTTFRKQLKLLGTRRAIATQPSSADYTLLLANAQLIAKKLGEQGEAPRDLLDIRDFIVLTLKPPSKAAAAPRPRAKAAARAPSEADDDIADDDQSE
ncbi:MAG TPA: hypothetical protein VFQ61_13505, partial [Polyangiaceae bacterium]|nr:hypothetical protein [Polyangiaceae bacterium]